MSDLPPIRNGAKKEEIGYSDDPQSHFQRTVSRGLYTPRLTSLLQYVNFIRDIGLSRHGIENEIDETEMVVEIKFRMNSFIP